MARRKNVKRIDPRYFLNEKVERLDEFQDDPMAREAQEIVDTMERSNPQGLKGASKTFRQMFAPQYAELKDLLVSRDGTSKFLDGYEKMLSYMSTTQQRPHQAQISPRDLADWMNDDPKIKKLLGVQ